MPQLITLRSGLAGNAGGLSRVRESLKLSLRAFANRRATFGWLQLLNSHPLFHDLVRSNPRLVYKIYRPYLSNTFNCAQRLALLQQHYRFIFQHGLGPLVVRAARAPVVLAQAETKSGASYHVQLRAVEPLEREGELVLQLMHGEQLVYSAAFSFFQQDGRMALGIGCMQGPQGDAGLDLIREATRELHGLRPKNLMLRLLRQLGYSYGCEQLRLVGNGNRAVRTAARKGRVFADYDALWQELDAQPRADGDFQLRCEALQAPVMADIVSKKRSEARKRHEMLEALCTAVYAGMQAPRMAVVASAPAAHDFSDSAAVRAMLPAEFSDAVA
ncbi:DUF535 domain-containing protein [Oxalobacteraceae bacterium]|nr:DUF535 domain-containing protein [Oxalobacteraceae bacterium]